MAVPLALLYSDREHELESLPVEQRRLRELIRGVIVSRPEPGPAQREVADLLFRLVDGFASARRLGTVRRDADVRLDPYDVLIPDLCFLARERADLLGPHGVDGVPDLVVEVTAPELRRLDYVRKHAIYASSGVREYWYADPAASIFVAYELVGGRYEPIVQTERKTPSRVLPGLTVDVGALFLGPPGREFGPDL
jgi:Uma2 family endonuclease